MVDPFISVVVPTYNRRASLLRLLPALGGQSYPAEQFEVIVVDDGSSDGTPDAVRRLELPYRLHVLIQDTNQGPAAARNRGVEHARGVIVLFLDDDVVPLADLVARHAQLHKVQLGVVVVGPMMAPREWPRPAWVRWEEDMLERQYHEMLAGKYPCTPRQFYTANASLRRADFEAVGGFDPAFKRAEDVELAYRLRDRGARFVFNPHAQVLHYAARSFASWRRAAYLYGRYDVVMEREKGHEALRCAAEEFLRRRPLNRQLTRLCVGRPLLLDGALLALGALAVGADRLGATRPAAAALSGIFGLLYWQGACDELGGRKAMWSAVAQGGVLSTDVFRPVSPPAMVMDSAGATEGFARG
ncbi:MAG TPA: glycosyltransferase [Chloroflexota bacterium]|nr:glycosyltransferase [Chloroflexota bacterium]